MSDSWQVIALCFSNLVKAQSWFVDLSYIVLARNKRDAAKKTSLDEVTDPKEQEGNIAKSTQYVQEAFLNAGWQLLAKSELSSMSLSRAPEDR